MKKTQAGEDIAVSNKKKRAKVKEELEEWNGFG